MAKKKREKNLIHTWKYKLIPNCSLYPGTDLVFPKAQQNTFQHADATQVLLPVSVGSESWASPEACYWKFCVSPDFLAFEKLIHTQSNRCFCTSIVMQHYQGLWHRRIWSSKAKSFNECTAHALFIMLNPALELGNAYANSLLEMWFYIPHLENSIKKSRCLAKKAFIPFWTFLVCF